MKKTLRIIGHRGAPSFALENTLDSFRRAGDMGLREVEFDVRLASDGVPMVIHDANLKRTHGKSCRVINTPAPQLVQHGVPTLDDVLDVIQQCGLHATVEIKACSPQAVCGIARKLDGLGLSMSSFDITWITQAHHAAPGLSLQWLVENLTRTRPIAVPDLLKSGKVPEIAADIRRLTHEGVSRAREMGLDVLAYTVKTRQELEKAQLLGLDGIFVDDYPQVQEWIRSGS